MLSIRPATPDDVQAIVDIHITSWKAQFIPFLTPEQVTLKDLDKVHQCKVWQERLLHEEGKTRITFLAEKDYIAVGYITGRESSLDTEAELHQIYVSPSAHRQGIGQQMFTRLVQTYDKLNKTSMFVWVMTINPAVAFYRDYLGGILIEERLIPEGDGILKEAKYRWQLVELRS